MSTFKRYLGFQAMTFVFGIVGPIFLIMFFASQPDPQLRWAFWFGLFITYADVMAAIGLTATTGDTEGRPDLRGGLGQRQAVRRLTR